MDAADPDRPGLAIVRQIIDSGVVQHVLVQDTDRLARDPWHIIEFIRYCKDRGVLLHFADGTTVASALDEALQYFKGLFGLQEREKIAERTMEGKIATAKDNRMPNGCGRGMYGYDYDAVTQTRSINEEEAAIVRLMFDWALGGVSCYAIARRLREKNIHTKTGCLWSCVGVHRVLTTMAYTGFQWWGTKRYVKLNGGGRRVTPKPKEEWILIVGFSPQIIDVGVFEAVQAALGGSRRRGSLWDYFFTPFFTCGECGESVRGATQKVVYPYYRCAGSLANEQRPRICYVRSYRADRLEPVIWEHICDLVRDPTGVISDLRAASEDGGAGLDRRISRLKSEVDKGRRQAATLAMQVAKDLIDQEMFESLVAPMNNLMLQREREMAMLLEQKERSEGLDQLEEYIRACFSKYAENLDSLDSEGKQRLMRLLNVQIVGGPGRVTVTGVLDPSLFTIERTLA